MKRFFLILLSTFLIFRCTYRVQDSGPKRIEKIYHKIGIQNQLSFDIFKKAYKGYSKIDKKDKKSNIISIIDFTKPSTSERLFIINLDSNKILIKCLVAHGENTGENYALHFSNKYGSHKSSLGFFLTAETYMGKNGYSLRLDGLEKGINDNARERDIVIHGADYVSLDFVKIHGRLGRSWGCPAIPYDLNEEIINLIANGTVLFIYSNDKDYLINSKFIL